VPYNVYGGTQDNGTWGGPSRSRSSEGIRNQEWYSVGGGDGFYAVPDPRDPSTVYAESQFGVLYRRDVANWRTSRIRPRQDEEHERYRFNWNSPIVLSHHNSEIVYFGGNRLFKSFDRGDSWPIVSEDLTTADPEKLAGNVPHCTLTTVAESPFDPSCVLVGSDDGLVHITRDGCLTFENLAGRFPGVPSNWWVNRVEFSPHDRDTAYVAFTGYREDDFRAFLYKTTDGCETWRLISNGIPAEAVNVVREDPVVPGVLYVGTELGAHVSLDGGGSWAPLGAGLPTISVYDLVVHPRDGDLVAGTHGRGFWVLDVRVLRQLAGEGMAEGARLFDVGDALRLQRRNMFGWNGQANFAGANPPDEARVAYWLPGGLEEDSVELWIEDVAGKKLKELSAGVTFVPGSDGGPPTELEGSELSEQPGLYVTAWDLRGRPSEQRGEGRRGSRGGGVALASAGRYTAVLKVGEETFRSSFELAGDPLLDGRMSEPEDEVDTLSREDG